MSIELKDNELEAISGGRYELLNDNRLFFETIKGTFHVKQSCRASAIFELESLQNVYATEEEYDAACLAKLQELGYLE